jgi:hypothetical protein
MAKVRFVLDTILADGFHRKGTEAAYPDDVAKDLARLQGVVLDEAPKKKKRGRKKRDDV